MKPMVAILLISLVLASGCVSSGGSSATTSDSAPPTFPEGGSGKSVLPTGKATGWGLPIEYPWRS